MLFRHSPGAIDGSAHAESPFVEWQTILWKQKLLTCTQCADRRKTEYQAESSHFKALLKRTRSTLFRKVPIQLDRYTENGTR